MGDKKSKSTGIGERLRLAREMAGLSQAQVATMLSLHRPSVSEMEAGRRKVSAEELTKLSEIYDVSMSWLTGLDKEEGVEESDRIKLAAREFAKLKSEDLERILDLLKALRTSEDTSDE